MQPVAWNTPIPLMDGRIITIQELSNEIKNGKQNWVYSCNPETGKIVPGIISWAGVTRKNTEVMKITFDNGKELICTPDHKFRTKEGEWIEAKDLQPGQSLTPLYRQRKKLGNTDYEQIKQLAVKHRKLNFILIEDKIIKDYPKIEINKIIYNRDNF